MFLVNSNAAKENYEKVEAEVQSCITRFGGEVVNSIKWDERRMAYEIMKQKRATYILVHFNAPHESIARIERQSKLSEVVLRVLITVDVDGSEAEPFSAATEDARSEGVPGARRDFRNKENAGT
jgi:ribosomal protein S6